jgi:hypothetical protein
VWIGFVWLEMAGSCENVSDLSGSIKGGEFLDNKFLKKDLLHGTSSFVKFQVFTAVSMKMDSLLGCCAVLSGVN